jgi:hypothetical protein
MHRDTTEMQEGLRNIAKTKHFGETDYNLAGLTDFLKKDKKVYDNFFELWEQYGPKITVGFCPSIENVMDTTEKLLKHGIRAKFMTSEPPMPKEGASDYSAKMAKYKKYVELHKAGVTATPNRLLSGWGKDFDILVSSKMLTTGFDFPAIQRVADFNPTESLNLYLQEVGRGTRPMENKVLELFDLAGNYHDRHGHPFAPHEYPFGPDEDTPRKKTSEAPTKECPKCKQITPASASTCSALVFQPDGSFDVCGFVFKVKKAKVRIPTKADFTETTWEEFVSSEPNKSAQVIKSDVSRDRKSVV